MLRRDQIRTDNKKFNHQTSEAAQLLKDCMVTSREAVRHVYPRDTTTNEGRMLIEGLLSAGLLFHVTVSEALDKLESMNSLRAKKGTDANGNG